MTPSPPLADSLQVVQISSLAAALVKLNIGIPIEDVIKAVHREDEAKRATLSALATQRRAALSTLALHSTKQSTGLHMTTVSMFIPKPTTPTNVDPLAKERRRRLVQLTKDSYPDGKVPDPFTISRLALSQDVAANKLPSILASHLPNDVTFIIPGQHVSLSIFGPPEALEDKSFRLPLQALLNRIQYQIQPVLINPQLTTQFSQAYGQIK
ncbi:hypothetical protein DFH07DRAFT_775491 [Mycena maculata]|uniref:Uncharacterized protein n=1 Tax=Mycena maculata TaxID=230809 RepID=A0AAD7N858_9AGAR|nr:hypothetical protein DFH07DRAFT_775491 [Mycena maculata]